MAHKHLAPSSSSGAIVSAAAVGFLGAFLGLTASRLTQRYDKRVVDRLQSLVDRIETVAVSAERRASDRQRAWYAGYLAGVRDQPLPDDGSGDVVVQLVPRRAARQQAQTPPITSTRS